MNEPLRTLKSVDKPQLILKKTVNIVCGKWRLLIIFQLDTQARRYSELRRMIPDVSEKILVQELKELIALGVVKKSAAPRRVQSDDQRPPHSADAAGINDHWRDVSGALVD